jgi:hypothetical protein
MICSQFPCLLPLNVQLLSQVNIVRPRLEYQPPHPIQQHNRSDNYPRQFQYRNFVSRLRHARKPCRAAF